MAGVRGQRQRSGTHAIDDLRNDEAQIERDTNGEGTIEARRRVMMVAMRVAMLAHVVVPMIGMVVGMRSLAIVFRWWNAPSRLSHAESRRARRNPIRSDREQGRTRE